MTPRVVIDLCASNSAGALTYARNLLPLLRESGRFAYRLVLRASQAAKLGEAVAGYPLWEAPEVTLRPAARLLWAQAALAPRLVGARPDLFFSPTDHPPPLLPCPLVVAVRNPTPYTDVDTLGGAGRRARERLMRALTRAATRRAARVIFVSRAAAETINAHLRVPEERVRVVHHGLDRVIARETDAPARPGLPADFVLTVSSFYRYKNYLRLVQALRRAVELVGTPMPLVLCGRELEADNAREVRAEVTRLGLDVRFLGDVGPAELAVLYRRARLFVFPSYLETFGHPLVEAMASGAAIAAGDIPTSRELCGEAALYFDPYDVDAIAEALARLWSDGEARRQLAAQGRERSREFSWEKTAAETEAVLAEALG